MASFVVVLLFYSFWLSYVCFAAFLCYVLRFVMRSQGFWTNDVVRSCMVVFHFVFAVLLLQLYLITSSSLAFAFRFLLVVGTVKVYSCSMIV